MTDLLSSSCSGLYGVFRVVKKTRRMVLCILLDFVILYGNNEHFQVNIKVLKWGEKKAENVFN